MQTVLLRVEPGNVVVYGLAVGMLASAVLLASALPAFQAASSARSWR